MTSAEWIKDILKRKHFSCFSYVVNGFRYIILWIMVGITVAMFIRGDDKNYKHFRCLSKNSNKKDLIQEQCFSDYLTSLGGHFPILGFPLLKLFFIGIVAPMYSFSVKKRVKSLENDDVESQSFIQTSNGVRLFWSYFCQLLMRILLESMFLILQITIPSYIPPTFTCHLHIPHETEQMNVTNALTSNATGTVFGCLNSGAEKSASFILDIVCTFDGIFAALAFIEILCIAIKAIDNRNFIRDDNFFQAHLKNACTGEKTQKTKLDDYLEKMKKHIEENTKNYKPIMPNIADEFGKTKLLECDLSYTDLIIYLGIVKHEFSGEREEEIDKYPRILEKRVRITKLEDIFTSNKDQHQFPLDIMIVGRPGIGKSFLCQRLYRSWAKDELFKEGDVAHIKQFKFVYCFKFRIFNDDKNMNLEQLLGRCQCSGPISKEVYSCIRSHPEKVLLIFDGLDEFKNKSNIDEEEGFKNTLTEAMPFYALYAKLVMGKLLKGATVVTTSRTTALSCVANIRREDSQRTMEILGFDSVKIKECVDKFFSQEVNKQKNWDHIRINANLLSLCYVPLNCHIVCMSLHERLSSKEKHCSAGLPSTLTEIYEDAYDLIVNKHNPKRRKTISEEILEANLEKFRKLALKGIEEGRLIFESHEVDMNRDDTNLLHQLPDKTCQTKSQAQFCFLHLTIQEFLAAKEIVSTRKHDCQLLKEWVSSHIHLGKWQLVIQFVAGLLRHEDKSKVTVFTDILPHSTLEKGGAIVWPNGWNNKCLVLILFKCLFEIQSKSLTSDWSSTAVPEQTGDVIMRFDNCKLSDADMISVVHVLQYLKSALHWVDVHFNFIGPLGCSEVCKLLNDSTMRNTEDKFQNKSINPNSYALPENECKLTILNIGHNNIGDEGLNHLSDALSTNECKLTMLNIGHNQIGDDGVKHLSVALSTNECKLTTLDIGCNEIGADGVKHLSDALSTNECKLTTLDIGYNKIGDNGVKHLSDALSTNDCKLTTLNIQLNKIGDEGLNHLSDALSTNDCKLTTLDIKYNEIGDDGVKHLSDALSTNECKLATLDISGNEIGDDGLKHLSDALTANECKLNRLNISRNEIGDDGVKYLSDALSTNECKLTTLDISGNEIGDDGVKHLSDALSTNECKLTTLDISANEIGVDGVKHLSDALSTNNCKLTTLNINNNQIGANGLKHLSVALSTNECKLATLNIGNNQIGDDGVKHLSDALFTNECKLITLDISVNEIGDGVEHLSDALSTNNCKLTTLDISENEIGDDGVKHLLDALSTNECKLSTVNTVYNYQIGYPQRMSLFDALAAKRVQSKQVE